MGEAGDELLAEALGPPLGVGRAFAHPGVQHLAGVGACCEQRMVPKSLRVAVGGADLVLAVHLADRRVEVDDEAIRETEKRPGAGDRLSDHGVELADVAEGEAP